MTDSVDRLSLKADDEIVIEKCAACLATPQAGRPLQECGGCRSIKYCSRECQLAHRKEHRVDCNILKYEKLAYKRWCLDQNVEDGLYDLRESTREECPICMIGIPEPASEVGIGLETTHCCFQTICASCKYAHAQVMKKDNIKWLVKSKYYAHENIDIGTDDPTTWKNTAFHCPFCRVSIAASKEEFKARRAAKVKGKTDAQVCRETLFSITTDYLLAIHDAVEKQIKVPIDDQKKYMENLCRSAYLGHPHALKLLSMIYMGANRLFDFNQLGIPVDLKKGSLMMKASAKMGKVGCASTHRILAFDIRIPSKILYDEEEPSWLTEKRNLLHLKAAAFYGDKEAVSRVKTLNELEEDNEVYNDVYDEDLFKALKVLGYASFDAFTVELESMYNDYCERVHSEEREQHNILTKADLGVIPTMDEVFDHAMRIGIEAQEKLGCEKPEVRFNIQALQRLYCGKDMTEEEKVKFAETMNSEGIRMQM